MWKNIVKPCRPPVTIMVMCIASWIPKSKNIHSVKVIIIAFSPQRDLHVGATVVCYKYYCYWSDV